MTISDAASATVGTAIESGEVFGISRVSGGGDLSAHGINNAYSSVHLSGGGDLRARGYGTRRRTARQRYEWPMAAGSFCATLGAFVGALADGGEGPGAAVGGVVGIIVGCAWARWPDGSTGSR